MKIFGSFRGFEQRFGVSRLYIVFVTDAGIFGGWIADRDYEESLARLAAMGNGGLAYGSVSGVANKAFQLEEQYRSSALDPQSFLARHRQNFFFSRGQISQITIDYNAISANRPNRRAMLTIEGQAQTKTFALVGEVNMAEATEWLRQAGSVTVRGAVPGQAPVQTAFDEPQTPVVVPGQRAREANQICWIIAIFVGLICSVILSFNLHSWVGFFMMILSWRVRNALYGLYLARNLGRDTAEYLEYNRQK